jgi:hypothetical protein
MFGFFKQALDEIMEEWRRQADVRGLSALNDHLLADIGLRREQLPTYMMPRISEDEVIISSRPASQSELISCG